MPKSQSLDHRPKVDPYAIIAINTRTRLQKSSLCLPSTVYSCLCQHALCQRIRDIAAARPSCSQNMRSRPPASKHCKY